MSIIGTFLNRGRQLSSELDAAADSLSTVAMVTRLDDALNWARKYSLFAYPFVTACCGMEYMAVNGPRFDMERFGAAFPRFSPRQADMLMVVGTITHRMAPVLKRVYEQMAEPKWVVSFGACTSSGGPYNNYAVVQGIDTIIPVDMYIPGCPPHPQAVLDGLMKLQAQIQEGRRTRAARHGSGRPMTGGQIESD